MGYGVAKPNCGAAQSFVCTSIPDVFEAGHLQVKRTQQPVVSGIEGVMDAVSKVDSALLGFSRRDAYA